MDPKSLLIIGSNGQLGRALHEKYPEARCVDRSTLDISNEGAMRSYNWSGVKTIINAAAYTNVDGAETPQGRIEAWKVNADAAANLVAVAAQNDAILVHISSDYVFDGTQDTHNESEPFSPLSAYGASKAAGDIAVSLAPKYYILRTSWVIGSGKNFVRTMLGLGRKGISPTVVDDQIGRLTFTTEIVRAIDHLLYSGAAGGTYNVSNGGEPASWAEVTREIFRQAKFSDLTVTNTTTEKYFANNPEAAPRPLNSVLNIEKIKATGFVERDWRKDLTDYIKKELP